MAFTDNMTDFLNHLQIDVEKKSLYQAKTITTDIFIKRKMITMSISTEQTPQANHVPLAIYMFDHDKKIDVRQLGGGLKADKIVKYSQSTTLTTNLTDTGHAEGIPNFLAGGLIIYLPSTYAGDKDAILAKVQKHVALGTNVKIVFN